MKCGLTGIFQCVCVLRCAATTNYDNGDDSMCWFALNGHDSIWFSRRNDFTTTSNEFCVDIRCFHFFSFFLLLLTKMVYSPFIFIVSSLYIYSTQQNHMVAIVWNEMVTTVWLCDLFKWPKFKSDSSGDVACWVEESSCSQEKERENAQTSRPHTALGIHFSQFMLFVHSQTVAGCECVSGCVG